MNKKQLHTVAKIIAAQSPASQVKLLLEFIGNIELSGSDLMKAFGLSHRPTFRANYLNPALAGGWLERTQPSSPRSPTQCYRLSGKGSRWLKNRIVVNTEKVDLRNL